MSAASTSLSLIADGMRLGLSTGPSCAAYCLPVFLPLLLGERRRFWGNVWTLVEFSLGRLIAYAGLGMLFGYLGGMRGADDLLTMRAISIAYLILGGAMLLLAARDPAQVETWCAPIHRFSLHVRFPFVLGFLAGFKVCTPLLGAVARAIEIGSATKGGIYFIAFFAGTSAYLVPLVVVGFGNAFRFLRSVGKVACGLSGMIFLTMGTMMLMPRLPKGPMYEVDELALRHVLPEAEMFSPKQGDPPCRYGFVESKENGKRSVVGYVFVTSEVVPEVVGYAGPVPVLVGMDRSGRIVRIKLLPNQESPAFTAGVHEERFLKQCEGKSFEDAFEIGRDIDGVTGATLTTRAICAGIREASRRVAAVELAQTPPGGPAKGMMQAIRNPVNYFILLLFAWAVAAHRLRLSMHRYFTLLLSVLLLGFWGKSFFSVKHLVDLFMLRFPPLWEQIGWYLFVIGALGGALFFGRLYCGWVCPFGALTELLGEAGKRLGIKLTLSPRLDQPARAVKFLVLVATPLLYVGSGSVEALRFEPFAEIFTLNIFRADRFSAQLIWMLFIGVASLVCVRFFCKYLCPAGAGMAFVARFRFFGGRPPARCRECGECLIRCEMEAGEFEESPKPGAQPGECLLCERCAKCPR